MKTPQPTINFQLNLTHPLMDELQRVTIEQIDNVLWQLTSSTTLSEEAIHEARKSLKKSRAIVRLVRQAIGNTLYTSQNGIMRDAARQISGLRSSAVMIETLDYLAESFESKLPTSVYADLRSWLVTRHATYLKNWGNTQYPSHHLNQLRTLRTQINEWPIMQNSFSLLQPGLKRVYQRGQRCMAASQRAPNIETFHDWRKQVKYLRYPIEILVQINPVVMRRLANSLHDLSDYLGTDHDLAELRQILQDNPERPASKREYELISALIEQKRLELQAGAWRVGEVVYGERPLQFTNRLENYAKEIGD